MSSTSNSRPARKKADNGILSNGSVSHYVTNKTPMPTKELGVLFTKCANALCDSPKYYKDILDQTSKTTQLAITSNSEDNQLYLEISGKNCEAIRQGLENDNLSKDERMAYMQSLESLSQGMAKANNETREFNERLVNNQNQIAREAIHSIRTRDWCMYAMLFFAGIVAASVPKKAIK